MKLSKFLKLMGMLTIVGLCYTRLQMSIIDLAYRGKAKEKIIHQLVEDNGNLTYTILTLKSANNLGIQLLTDQNELHFADSSQVMRVSFHPTVSSLHPGSIEVADNKKSNPLLSLLSLDTKAEARNRP